MKKVIFAIVLLAMIFGCSKTEKIEVKSVDSLSVDSVVVDTTKVDSI